MSMMDGKAVPMTQGCSKKRSLTESMDSQGHQKVISTTVTLRMLFSIVSSMFVNNSSVYWLVLCVCRVILLGGFGPTNWH